jgi:hypothetical protein
MYHANGCGGRWPEGVFTVDELRGVREAIVYEVLLFLYLKIFNRGVAASDVRVSDESGVEKAYEV